MLHKSHQPSNSFEAGDKTRFIELLHPKNEDLDIGFSLGHASLEVGTSSLPHILKACSETYYFLRGEGKVFVDSEVQKVRAGDTVYISKGARQYVENTGTTTIEFLCIVEPSWYPEQEEID